MFQLLIALRARARPRIQDHEIVRKIGKRADYQNEVSAIFTMRLENLCERGARVLQIEIMGAFFGVSLNLAFGVMARDAKVLNSTKVVKAIRWRVEWIIKKEASDQSIRNHLLKVLFNIIVISCLSSHIKAALVRLVANIVTVISLCRHS